MNNNAGTLDGEEKQTASDYTIGNATAGLPRSNDANLTTSVNVTRDAQRGTNCETRPTAIDITVNRTSAR